MAEWTYTRGDLPMIAGASVVVLLDGPGAESYARELLRVVPTAATVTEVLDHIVALGDLATLPAFFIGVGSGRSLVGVVRGAITIDVRTGEGETLTVGGSSSRTWSEIHIEDVERATVSAAGVPAPTARPRTLNPGPHGASSVCFAPEPSGEFTAPSAREVAPAAHPVVDANRTLIPPAHHEFSDLPVAPAPGADRAPVAAHPPELVPPPARPPVRGTYDALFGQVTIVGRIEDAAVRESLEQPAPETDPEFDSAVIAVSAIVCPHDHANPPERSTCWKCSTTLAGGVVRRVPRPALGELRFDDGRGVPITGTILVGRSPRAERTDSLGIPELVVVESPNNDVSRTHARIFVDGWQVLLEDLGSTNGTLVTTAAGVERRIRAGEPAILVDGTRVDLGDGARFSVVGAP